MNEPLERAHTLLRKAEHDLITADCIVGNPVLSDGVCFHAQQAAEKSLKALLAADGVEYPRTHDIDRLLNLVEPRFSEFEQLRDELGPLSGYAVDARYADSPGAEPNAADAQKALRIARSAYELAQGIIAGREEGTGEQVRLPEGNNTTHD